MHRATRRRIARYCLKIVISSQFKKDLKTAKKRGLSMNRLHSVVNTLAAGEALPSECRDHNLVGDYAGFRECHVEPDWLLIYRVDGGELALFLFRTGTHSDLF